jgi:ribosomal protein S3
MKNQIAKLTGKKHETDPSEIRGLIRTYYMREKEAALRSITDVRVFKEKENLSVDITTHLPGQVIGKNAAYIKSLSSFLQKSLDQKININVLKSKLWDNEQ